MTDFIAQHTLVFFFIFTVLGGLSAIILAKALIPYDQSANSIQRIHTYKHALIALSMGVFLFTLFGVNTGKGWIPFDATLAQQIGEHISNTELSALAVFTHTGGVPALVLLALIVTGIMLRKKYTQMATIWGLGIIVSTLLNQGLKYSIQRPRPHFNPLFVHESGFSYTSGHSSGSMVILSLLAYILIRLSPKTYLPAIAFIFGSWIAAVGASRILLQVHYFSDVIGGFSLSLVCALVTISILERKQAFIPN